MSITNTGVRYDVIAKDSASKTFDKIGGSASKLHSGLGKLAKAGIAAGAAIAVGVGAGLAKSAKDAVDFEASMKKVQTQAGATAKDVKVLSAQVLTLGKSTQQGPEQLADSLYHLKSVGLDNVSAMKDLKVASDLAAVGGSDLEATTNALAGAWRSGIKGAESFGKSAATVNAIIGAGNMRMEDFVAAIGTGILPSAKSFGLSLQSVGSALALMTDEGIPAVDAATRLRMSISLLGAPSDKAEKQLKRIGLTGTSLAKEMRSPAGLVGAIGLLKTSLDKSGLSAVQQSQLISKAFGGGRSSSGILTLLNNYTVLKKKQDQVNASMGKFPAAVAAQRKTAAAQLALIKSNLEVFSIKTGDLLLPPLTRFVTYVNKTGIPTVHRFGTELVTKFVPVDKIKKDFSTVTSVVTDFFTGLKGPKKPPVIPVQPKLQLAKNLPPDALDFGARASVTVLPRYQVPKNIPPSLVKYGLAPHPSDQAKAKVQVKSQAQQMGDSIRKALSGGIGDAAKSIDWSKIGKFVGDGLGKAVDWVVTHASDLSKKFAKVFAAIDFVNVGKSLGGTALPFAIGFVNNLMAPLFTVDFWKKHWLDTIIAVISLVPIGKVADAVGGVFSKIPWGKLGDVLDHVPWGKMFAWARWIGDTAGPAVTAAGRLVSRLATGFTQGFTRVFPRIGQFFSDQLYILPDRLGDLGRLLSRKGTKVVKDLGNAIVKQVPLLGSKFVQGLLKIWGRFTFWQTGINLIEGLLSGISTKLQGFGKWAKHNIVDPVVNWVKSLFGVHSPSTVFASIGRFLISGLLGGVLSGMAGIGKWLHAHVISPVTGAFASAGGWLYSKGSSLVSGLKSGITAGVGDAGRWVGSHIKSPLVNALSKPTGWLYGKGKDVISGFWSGLKEPWSDVQKWVGGIAKWIKDHKGPISFDRQLLHPAGVALMSGLLNGLKVGFKGVGSFVHKTGSTIAGTISSITSSIFGGRTNDLVGNWATDVRTVLSMLGASPEALGPVLTRIRMESGGNPKAINLTDSNARAGHPSQGLMQTIPSTFNTYAGPLKGRGITDPMASIYAGVNYAMHRYGANWVKVMTRPGGYATGGLAPFGQTAWVGERGPELMQVTPKGTRIINSKDSLALAKGAGIQIPGYAAGTAATHRVSAAQRKVSAAEASVTAWRHRETAAHYRSTKRADQLQVEAAEKRVSAAKAELATAKKLATASTSVKNTLANGFLKTIETGTASAIASAVKSMNSKLQAAGAGSLVSGMNRNASKLESLATQKAGVVSKIATAKSYATDQASSLGDYLSVGGTSATSVSDLVTQMKASQKTAGAFATEVASLSKRGLNKNLLSQLGSEGPGGSLAAILGTASNSDIGYLNKVAASQSKLTVSFGNTMADSMYDAGSQAGKGFLTGLTSQEKALQAEMNKLGGSMVKTMEHKLGIHSPSTVTRDRIGKQFVMGAVAGVRMHTPAAQAEAQRMADTMAAVRARGGRPVTVSGGGRAAAVQHVTHVHVHFDDPALRDLIRVEVEDGHTDLASALGAM